MKEEIRLEWRFYVCIIIGAALMFAGFFAPPLGNISNSVLWGAGMFLVLGGLAVGLDIKGCIREIRLLRQDIIKDNKVINEEEKMSENE